MSVFYSKSPCSIFLGHFAVSTPTFFLISPTSDPSDFLLNRAMRAVANNPYLMVRSRSEYYTSMSVSGLPAFLISVKNMNLLSSSIYKHLKTYLIKHKQSLILGECGSQLISVLMFHVLQVLVPTKRMFTFTYICIGVSITKRNVSVWHFNKTENGI